MAKQPYIPLYTGDYLRDTRVLPLEVRGAWVDLMIYMWESKERGTITARMDEFALMLGCSFKKANQIIALLQEKGICDYEVVKNGQVKLISRRMVRDAGISKSRSEAGKEGVKAKFAKAFAEAKPQANSDIDIDNGITIQKEPEKKVSKFEVDAYESGKQAFEEIQGDELMVDRLVRVVRNEGYPACDEVTVMKAVKRFLTGEEAKPGFTNRPRDELKKHLVNWLKAKAKTINQ